MNHKAKAIELLNIGHKCEVCGQPVKIYSGDEETNHYEGLAIDVVVGLLEKISELEKNYKEDGGGGVIKNKVYIKSHYNSAKDYILIWSGLLVEIKC